MSLEPLFEFCEREGRFPDVADISNFLDVIRYEFLRQKRSLPQGVNLKRYGESKIYCLEDSFGHSMIRFPGIDAIPFTAFSDEEALKKLEEELQKYKTLDSEKIFNVGTVQKVPQDEMFEEMLKNPRQARDEYEMRISVCI
ncbi:hypothetical protein COU57_06990 [Candidatus Pacearchaeota archaeon CG10_big_fil_rev_8_21_14_0_10_32_14]|nr:MAG: hypothetical protein COU57_06990 [Candidatus Pacearchaeota archaeon CG10_big_fil_rev_8_21_14_0_10_32_14]